MNSRWCLVFFICFVIIYFFLGDFFVGLVFDKLMEKNIVGALSMMFKPNSMSAANVCGPDKDIGLCIVVSWRDYSFFISIAISLLMASNFWNPANKRADSIENDTNHK